MIYLLYFGIHQEMLSVVVSTAYSNLITQIVSINGAEVVVCMVTHRKEQK